MELLLSWLVRVLVRKVFGMLGWVVGDLLILVVFSGIRFWVFCRVR